MIEALPVRPSPELDEVLRRMAQLLADDGQDSWAANLRAMADKGWRTTAEARSRIHALYGGMGSLNDIILQKDGRSRIDENTEFDRLRSRLSKLSRQL